MERIGRPKNLVELALDLALRGCGSILVYLVSGLWLMGFILAIIRGVNPSLKAWVAAPFTVGFILGGLGLVTDHAAADDVLAISVEYAGLVKLGHKRFGLTGRQPCQARKLTVRERLAVHPQIAARLCLVHDTEHFHPKPACAYGAHAQGWVGAPVSRIEFEPGTAHDSATSLP